MIFTLLFVTSILAAGTFLLADSETGLRKLSLGFSTLTALFALTIAIPVLASGTPAASLGFLRADAFSALLMALIAIVQWTATLVSGPYLREELHEKIITLRQMRLYHVMVQLFVLSMMLALTSDNIGVMWIALEATTLATTMLVAFYIREGSLEAAWKYIVLCSVGISLGLLGVLIVFYAASSIGAGAHADDLSWTLLRELAPNFSPAIMRWAFAFIFIGYGAKVGIVPMHTWLPDAHSRTPSPISAMLSGVLLNVALFAIVRFKGLTDLSLGSSDWTNGFFLFFGALTFILPAAFILAQKNYKRLLAYSSIEHMGFMVFSIGLGPIGAMAAAIHMVGHALAKSLLFFGAGNILLRWKSTNIGRVGSVASVLPFTGRLFVPGLLALLAIPPSPLFVSEYLAFSAGIGLRPWLTLGMLLAGTVIFAGMIMNLMPMIFSKKADEKSQLESWNASHTAMAVHLILLVVFGIAFMTPAGQHQLQLIANSML